MAEFVTTRQQRRAAARATAKTLDQAARGRELHAASISRKRRAAYRRSLLSGGGEAAALGTSQSYRPHPTGTPVEQPQRQRRQVPPEVAAIRQSYRWGQLLSLRKLSSKRRTRKCKTPIGAGRVGITGHDNGAHFTGLESCANVWACPVCAPKIRAARTADVLLAFDRHAANGGGFMFLTQTIWHERGEALALLLDLLGGACKSVAEQRAYKDWKKRLGVLGNITALEVTDGGNGWHPHRHVMLLTERPPTRDEVAAFESVLDELFARWLTKHGRKKAGVVDQATGRKVGVRLEYVAPGEADQLGRYITKLQAGFELTRGDLKVSRNAKGRLPFDLLDAAILGGDDGAAALARWWEYEAAMTGKSAVRFSKGLRAHLGMTASKTDQELADEEVTDEPSGVYLSAPLYRRLFSDGHVPAVLQAYHDGGDLAVLGLVTRLYPGKYTASDEEYDGILLLQ